ncbi:MAG TPA: C1 family peptidase [Candidatus Acidoferrales bacterium]|nr:C1 family peptidase [Candidatus Acidoferrales bacterium]
MGKTKFTVTLLITVLLFSLSLSIVQLSNFGVQANPATETADNGGLSVTAHPMTAAELQEYKQAVGTYEDGQNYNRIVAGHGTGLSPPDAETWEAIAENAYTIDKVNYQTSLPTAVDHTTSAWFPPIGDQGYQGSCASFAIGYYCKTFQEAKEHNWNLTGAAWTGGYDDGNISLAYQDMVMSPAFVYNLVNGGRNIGSDFETPIQLLCNVGVSSWAKMPYYWQDCQRWPTEEAWAEAPLYRCNSTYSYQYLHVNTTQGIESLKNWLAAGNIAVIGIDASNNLVNFNATSNQDLFTTDNYVVGCLDHAATIVGYDDSYAYTENGTTHYGAIKIANTWGKGGWETIPDGCYWISYNTMLELATTEVNPVMLFENVADYQPEILATFNITHETTSDCNITFGIGTPDAPTATKSFTKYVSVGNKPFCQNNIVFDLTELKNNLTGLYNQSFYMSVYDGGTNNTGTINYFAIANVSSTQAPMQTAANDTVTLTVFYSLAEPTVSVLPAFGAPLGEITLNGVGFTGSTVDIACLNPQTQTWTTITENLTVATNFTYSTRAPDLQLPNPAGDNAPLSDQILFRVHDDGSGNSYNTTTPYTEWRRGLTQVDTQTATGIIGNNTDLSTSVLVRNGETIAIAGKWFAPGTATIFWDNLALDTATINQDGAFTTTVTIPVTSVGQHTLTVDDGTSNVRVTVTRQQTTSNTDTGAKRTITPTPTTTATASPSATPAPTIPEYNSQAILVLLILLTTSLLLTIKIKTRTTRNLQATYPD